MAGISAIGSSNNIYGSIASGNRINSAADDASGLAISQKLEKEKNGLTQGADNSSEGIGAVNIADGALSQINDNLQRLHELSVKAGNSFMYGEEEIGYMQSEADQILKGIADIADNTNYNGKPLIDGSESSIHIASNPDGSGMDIEKVNSSLKSLGLENFDISSKDAINQVSDAIKYISGGRASLGSASVRLEYAKNYNDLASENTLAAQSRIKDLDIGKAVSDKQKKELLQNYQLMMVRKQQEQKRMNTTGLFQF